MACLQIGAKPLSKLTMVSCWLYTQEQISDILINYVAIGLDYG